MKKATILYLRSLNRKIKPKKGFTTNCSFGKTFVHLIERAEICISVNGYKMNQLGLMNLSEEAL